MTFYDVCIGDRSGGRISPLFPPAPGGRMEDRPFCQVIQRIEQGQVKGKQVDWGAWEAKVSKSSLEQFVDDVYSGYDWYTPGSPMPHLLESFEELKCFVENLEPGRQYPLVASEL